MMCQAIVSIGRSTIPYRLVIEVGKVFEGKGLGDGEERYWRVVPFFDDVALLEDVRQALNGRVLGGEWDLVEGVE